MKGTLRIHGSVRVSGFDLEIDVQCEGFDEVENTLSWVDRLKRWYPPSKEQPR